MYLFSKVIPLLIFKNNVIFYWVTFISQLYSRKGVAVSSCSEPLNEQCSLKWSPWSFLQRIYQTEAPSDESLVAAPRWALVLCQFWKSCSLLHWSVLFHWPNWKWDPWSQVALKRASLPSIHSFIYSFRVTCSGCLFEPPSHTANNSMPLWGEKMIPVERKFGFLQLSCTWQLFENSYAGNSLFRFCIQWTGKSMANFLCTIHPDRGNLLKLA